MDICDYPQRLRATVRELWLHCHICGEFTAAGNFSALIVVKEAAAGVAVASEIAMPKEFCHSPPRPSDSPATLQRKPHSILSAPPYKI
jgi:hypothetical protein